MKHRYMPGELHPSYKHGYGKTPLCGVWREMNRRCTDPRVSNYNDYGGRGITVCAAWRKDFVLFREWALSNGYEEGLFIDRIDNDMGYGPENCRWVTRVENNRNKRVYKSNRSGQTGVFWRKQNNCWQAKISVGGKNIHIGLFDNLEDAIRARKLAEEKYWRGAIN
jgi:hypothetical protein